MASIGPQLPPHLQKRKRTPDDDNEAAKTSPRAKVSRRENGDEIPLGDDDSDDGFGPSAPLQKGPSIGPSIGPSLPPNLPSSRSKSKSQSSQAPAPRSIGPSLPPAPTSRSIGPTLPPTTNQDEIALVSDASNSDSDNTGPAPPRAATAIGPSLPPPPPKRVLGPAPPPASLSQRPTTDPNDSDSDSDSDWGPSLPTAPSHLAAQQAAALLASQQPTTDSSLPKRDDWMIAPPTSTGYTAADPTKLKNRKFAGGARSGEKPSGVSSIWTETPEEKLKRLTNAVLGREDPNNAAAAGPQPSGKESGGGRQVDEEQIKAFTEQTRGRSLVAEHQAARAAGKAKKSSGGPTRYGGPGGAGNEEGDDPSKRAFDREKDMAVGGQLSNVKKRELMNKAANFGGRFQKGSYL